MNTVLDVTHEMTDAEIDTYLLECQLQGWDSDTGEFTSLCATGTIL